MGTDCGAIETPDYHAAVISDPIFSRIHPLMPILRLRKSVPKTFMTHKIKVPLKYKFLSVLLFITFLGFISFFYFAHQTFSEDKKLFVMELNLASLKATLSELKLELRGRMDELQILVPRVYQASSSSHSQQDPYQGLSGNLQEEVFSVTFLKKKEDKLEIIKRYSNQALLEKEELEEGFAEEVDKEHPIEMESLPVENGMTLLNRSVRASAEEGSAETDTTLPILTILFNGTFLGNQAKEVIVAVDLHQDFLRKKLKESEMAEIFLIAKNGTLLSHMNSEKLVEFASQPYPHPIVSHLKEKVFPRESFELDVDNEAYLCNLSETGFENVFAISQVKKSQAFIALQTLLRQTVLIAVLILSLALVLSTLFASGLTRNIQKLKEAAEQIGKGDWNIKLDVRSNDEVENVAESFQWMSNRLVELMKETVEKARMEKELDTAKLVQSTLLANTNTPSPLFDLVPFYQPASECGGDFWDSYLSGNKLTLVIGDATGHGAGAAIVTAVAKSSFSTLNKVTHGKVLTPEQFLTTLNSVIHTLCKEKLLMTMCVIQLDLMTGILEVCNAGHESPFLLRKNTATTEGTEKKKNDPEILFNRGERLGFSPHSTYTSDFYQIALGDSVLLYTDGISEAKNKEGKELGERALKKTFGMGGVRSLAQIRDDIMAKTNTHISGAPQEDDITFVLVSWSETYTEQSQNPKAA